MNLSSNNMRGSSPIPSLATVSQPFVTPVGSTGSIDHARDLTILSRLSGGTVKWASSTDSLTWTPYTPNGFTPKAPAVFGGPNQPYTFSAAAYTMPAGNVMTGAFNIASNADGTLMVAVDRQATPAVPRRSNGGGLWANSSTTFPTDPAGFELKSIVFVNGRFLLYLQPSNSTWSSTDGNNWTRLSTSSFFGGNGTWVASPNTSYAMSDHGSVFYRYEGIGTTATEITGIASTTPSVYQYNIMAPGGTSANGFLFHNRDKFSYYTGTGTTVTATGTSPTGRAPYIVTWDKFNNRWLAVFSDKYETGANVSNPLNKTLAQSTDNGATWTTLSTSLPDGGMRRLEVTSANCFILFMNSGAVFISDNTWTWQPNSFGSVTGGIYGFFTISNGQSFIGGGSNLLRVTLATSVIPDYRSWRYTYFDPTTSTLEIRFSKTGSADSWSNATVAVTTAINNNTSLGFRSYNFLDYGETVFMAASVDKPGHSNTGPLVLKSTNGGTSWSPSLDLRGSVTGYVITDPGQYSMAPTITLTAVSTSGTPAVFTPILRSVYGTPTITFGGTGLTTQVLGAPSGGGTAGAPPLTAEVYSIIKNGAVDQVVVTRKGMNVNTGTVGMTGTFPTGSTNATVSYTNDVYTGLTDITLTNIGSGYPPGRYELTITKNPSDPAAGGGKAFVEIGSPNTAWQTIVGKGTGQNFITLAPSGLIDYSKGSFSSSNVYVTTNGGTSWTRYGLPGNRTSGLHPQPSRVNGTGTIIIRGAIYFHHTTNPGLLVYGSQIRPTGNTVQQVASVYLGNETTVGVPSFANPGSVSAGSTSFQTGNYLYSAVVSAASPGNATTGSNELAILVHFVSSSAPTLVQHAIVRTNGTGSIPSFLPVAGTTLSYAVVGVLMNKIDYNQREGLWVAYFEDGRVMTAPLLTSTTWTTVTNPGNLF